MEARSEKKRKLNSQSPNQQPLPIRFPGFQFNKSSTSSLSRKDNHDSPQSHSKETKPLPTLPHFQRPEAKAGPSTKRERDQDLERGSKPIPLNATFAQPKKKQETVQKQDCRITDRTEPQAEISKAIRNEARRKGDRTPLRPPQFELPRSEGKRESDEQASSRKNNEMVSGRSFNPPTFNLPSKTDNKKPIPRSVKGVSDFRDGQSSKLPVETPLKAAIDIASSISKTAAATKVVKSTPKNTPPVRPLDQLTKPRHHISSDPNGVPSIVNEDELWSPRKRKRGHVKNGLSEQVRQLITRERSNYSMWRSDVARNHRRLDAQHNLSTTVVSLRNIPVTDPSMLEDIQAFRRHFSPTVELVLKVREVFPKESSGFQDNSNTTIEKSKILVASCSVSPSKSNTAVLEGPLQNRTVLFSLCCSPELSASSHFLFGPRPPPPSAVGTTPMSAIKRVIPYIKAVIPSNPADLKKMLDTGAEVWVWGPWKWIEPATPKEGDTVDLDTERKSALMCTRFAVIL